MLTASKCRIHHLSYHSPHTMPMHGLSLTLLSPVFPFMSKISRRHHVHAFMLPIIEVTLPVGPGKEWGLVLGAGIKGDLIQGRREQA